MFMMFMTDTEKMIKKTRADMQHKQNLVPNQDALIFFGFCF